MINTFIDRLSGLLDKRFLVAYWGPAFVGAVLAGGLAAAFVGLAPLGLWWDGKTATQRFMLGLAGLLLVTIVAYLLQALTLSLVRAYEGYWPRWLDWLETRFIHVQKGRRARVHERKEQRAIYYDYPLDEGRVRATRLGNVMTAAEEYAYERFNADAVIWWPRLTAVLPEGYRTQVDNAFASVVSLLNLCTITAVWALVGGALVVGTDERRWLFVLVYFGGLVAAWLFYRAAVSSAADYGDLIRSAFDLYRNDLLKQLQMPVPANLKDEKRLWTKLGQFHYYNTPPWAVSPNDPLAYDRPSAPAPRPTEINVAVTHIPAIDVHLRGGDDDSTH